MSAVHRVEVGGTGLHAEVEGSGPPLVLLHGHTLDRRMWEGQLGAFARHFTVIRVDLRGYGRSGPPTADFRYSDDLHAVLTHLGVDRAHVLGLSLGGNVALEFALRHPGMTDHLVLAATSLRGFPPHPEVALSLAEVGEVARSDGVVAGRERWLAHPLFAAARSRPEVAGHLARLTRDYSGWHWQKNVSPSQWLDAEVYRRLEDIAAPTLILVGERDVPQNREIARTLARRLPHARLSVFGGVGHMLNLEASGVFTAQVLDFLTGRA
ncbi:alpha/beta fold hydrolase [Deinococcus planocerae]|uniref:alpha/beta fold hydrolase n=1 Tax=Deinococcus planocerae TaxID=1737569 RepID=UPI000C7EF9A9|nr:alpha/beta hydrolase [Deinococcus planocerae]